jgi:hypothetical protein
MHRDRDISGASLSPASGAASPPFIVSGTGGAFDRYGRCTEMTITKLVCTRGVTLAGCRREQGRGAVIARRRSQRTGRSPTGDRPIRQPKARPISRWVQTRLSTGRLPIRRPMFRTPRMSRLQADPPYHRSPSGIPCALKRSSSSSISVAAVSACRSAGICLISV